MGALRTLISLWVLQPEVMHENGVDMWITVNREGFEGPRTHDFGRGYVLSYGYYIFTERGIEWLYPVNEKVLLIR